MLLALASCEVSIGCPFGSGLGKLKLLKLWRTLGGTEWTFIRMRL
jgi:hypothetical protein